MISIVASMLETGTVTRFFLMSLIQSSKTIMESVLMLFTSDMDVSKIQGNIDPKAPVHSTRIRVGRNIDGFGLSPGITKEQRLGVETLMKSAFGKLTGELAGTYFPLTG